MFGARGRLGTICREVLARLDAGVICLEHQRDGSFLRREDGCEPAARVERHELARQAGSQPWVFVDASVDHRSTEALLRHEADKAALCEQLDRASLLDRAIGFSSGIAHLPARNIRADHPHMLAYREVKLRQMDLYAGLRCPAFLPSIFTLVGPVTYARQAAAWARILAERVRAQEPSVIHDPFSRRFWVDEATVAQALSGFAAGDHPASVRGPLVDGSFCLDDVARLPLAAGHPALRYRVGVSDSWCIGDYVCDHDFPPGRELAACLDAALDPQTSPPLHAHHL